AWTEAITNIRDGHVPDDVYHRVQKFFSEKELADLTFAVAGINAWNRLNIAARTVPGAYRPARGHEAAGTHEATRGHEARRSAKRRRLGGGRQPKRGFQPKGGQYAADSRRYLFAAVSSTSRSLRGRA